MNDPQLMKTFDFDEADLQANRNGRLTEKQRARLQKQEKAQKGCATFGGIFLFVIALIGLAIAISAGTALVREDRGAAIAVGAAFGCVWPLVWGGLGFGSVRRGFAKMKVEVKKAEGPINIVNVIRKSYNPSTQMHSEHSVHELHVGGRTFDVESDLADIMMQGDVYAVYYADFNLNDKEDQILSAEMFAKAN